MTQFAKILNHPDRDKIVTKLSSGDTAKQVFDWLKEKYAINKTNHISISTLEEFRRKYLNINSSILEDVKTKLLEQQQEELDKKIIKEVKRNKTYDEKLTEFIDDQVDWKKRLLGFLNVVETRFGQLYDKTQTNPDNYKPDYVMIQWMDKILKIVEDIRKVEGAPDQVIQHNVTVQAIDEQAAIFQQAIQKTIAELDLNTASILIDKLNNNIESLKHAKKPEGSMFYSERDKKKIETITARILPEYTEDNSND
jgi:hypothetical protein